MKSILLFGKRGTVGFAIVNEVDYARLNKHRWNLSAQGYAYRRDYTKGRPGVLVLMHREILGLIKGDGLQGDHKNRNRLDNRRRNLRIVTFAQQSHNMVRTGNFSSQFRGVSWDKKTNKWVAYVHNTGKKHIAGYFTSERKAAKAAKEMRLTLLSHALA